MKLDFFERFSKNIQISNFMKIRSVGTELFHVDLQTDGQTDRQTYKQADITKLIITFRNYSNATKTVTRDPLFLGISFRQQA
jgi:hypothetical protein